MDLTVILALCGKCEGLLGVALRIKQFNSCTVLKPIPGTKRSAATTAVINVIIINYISHSIIFSNVMTGSQELTCDSKAELREVNLPESNIRTE